MTQHSPGPAEIFQNWSLYDKVIHFNYMRHAEMGQVIHDFVVQQTKALRVVDLGCGDARLALKGLQASPPSNYLGVDQSRAALDAAKVHLQQLDCPCDLQQGDLAQVVEALPQHDADLLLASYSLHHFPEEQLSSVLPDIARALHSDGAFIWIDLLAREKETLPEYLQRIQMELPKWEVFDKQELLDIAQHVAEADFPLSQSTRLRLAREAGLLHLATMYRDDFYVADVFARSDESKSTMVAG